MTTVPRHAEDSCLKNQHDPATGGEQTPTATPIEKGDPGAGDGTQPQPNTVEADTGRRSQAPDSDLEANNSDTPAVTFADTFPEGGLQAWLVTFGSFCAMGAVFGLINSAGVFEAYFKANQLKDYSHSQIGWIFSLYLFIVFFVGIQVGPVFDQYGSRVLVATGSLLIVGSFMLLSISDQYYQIILTYSVMGGLGGALLNCPAYGAIAHFFQVRRGLATGVASTAGGIGGIVFPLLLQYLLGDDGVGFGWSCRILGFILLGLCVLANIFIRSRLGPPANSGKPHSVWPDFSIFRDKGYAMTAVGIFFMEWGLFIPLTYIVSYAKHYGYNDADGSLLLSLLNAGSVIGRFLPGFLSDKLGRFNVIIVTISLCATTVLGFWLPALGTKPLLIVFCVAFGFASGSNLGLVPVCVGQFCDAKDFGRYFTTANMIASFGTLTSVPIGGALLGLGGRKGWIGLILFSGLSYMIALGCYTYARVHTAGWNPRKKF